MHKAIVSLGQTILNFFRTVDGSALADAGYVVGIGMLGIFLVTGVIVLTVLLLNKLGSK